MLDYAHLRARELLQTVHHAVLATGGPAGVLASEFPCQADGLALYFLVPLTSDHLFNLESDPRVTVLAAGWEMKGRAAPLPPGEPTAPQGLLGHPTAPWCRLVKVQPLSLHVLAEKGWGGPETIDLKTT